MKSGFARLKNSQQLVRLKLQSALNKHVLRYEDPSQSSSENEGAQLSSTNQQTKMAFCRICFGSHKPLISPCLCKGSMSYVHEQCLIKWLVHSQRKNCELCNSEIMLYEERLSAKEILRKTLQYLNEDKKRCVHIMVYFVYLWILKYKLIGLIGIYFKTLFRMSARKMLKLLYNAFIIMLIIELAFEEYGRIRSVVLFFKRISVIIRIKGLEYTGCESSNAQSKFAVKGSGEEDYFEQNEDEESKSQRQRP